LTKVGTMNWSAQTVTTGTLTYSVNNVTVSKALTRQTLVLDDYSGHYFGRSKPKIRKTNFWRLRMASGWTPERRAQQSIAIRRWRPWERSTGPRTSECKAAVCRNAFKGGSRTTLRQLARLLRVLDKS
jgi:hypothetical protein